MCMLFKRIRTIAGYATIYTKLMYNTIKNEHEFIFQKFIFIKVISFNI